MGIHKIQAPTGKVYTFEAPEGATSEDLFAYTQHLVDQDKAHEAKTGFKPAMSSAFQQALGSADVGIAGALSGLGFPEEAQDFTKAAEKDRKSTCLNSSHG